MKSVMGTRKSCLLVGQGTISSRRVGIMSYLGTEGFFFFIVQFVFLVTVNHAKLIEWNQKYIFMGGFKQPTLPGHDSVRCCTRQFYFSTYLLDYTATLISVASRHVVYAWITKKMGAVGVQLPLGQFQLNSKILKCAVAFTLQEQCTRRAKWGKKKKKCNARNHRDAFLESCLILRSQQCDFSQS